jgi:hypothetical protein
MTLLFRLAEWHALAKLRMHTEHTLNSLHQSTVAIGQELRSFQEWTQAFRTVELPKETNAQQQRTCKKAVSKVPSGVDLQGGPSCHSATTSVEKVASQQSHKPKPAISQRAIGRTYSNAGLCPITSAESETLVLDIPDAMPKTKTFNLLTYKLHALGDYVQTIRLFGTTDSYSTQIVRSTGRLFIVFLTSIFHRVNLHTALSSASISEPIRRMQSVKLQNLNDAILGCAVPEKQLSPLESDMPTMLLFLRMTHSHIVQWICTIT